MGGSRLEFDLHNFSIRRAGGRITRAVWRAMKFVLSVLSLTLVAYAVFALFYSTDEEKALKAEINEYEELYPELPRKLGRIGEDLDRLSKKDGALELPRERGATGGYRSRFGDGARTSCVPRLLGA